MEKIVFVLISVMPFWQQNAIKNWLSKLTRYWNISSSSYICIWTAIFDIHIDEILTRYINLEVFRADFFSVRFGLNWNSWKFENRSKSRTFDLCFHRTSFVHSLPYLPHLQKAITKAQSSHTEKRIVEKAYFEKCVEISFIWLSTRYEVYVST